MYLKDAFRYQNYLDRLMDDTVSYLGNEDNVTKKKQIHFKSKAKNGAEDEEIESTPEPEVA